MPLALPRAPLPAGDERAPHRTLSLGEVPRATPDAPSARRTRLRDGALFLAPALLLIALFTLWPLVAVFRLTLYRWDGYGPQVFVGLDTIGSLAGDPAFRTALTHSVVWIVLAALVPTIVGLCLALLLARSRAGGLTLGVLFFPALLPPAVVAAIWLVLLSPAIGLPATLDSRVAVLPIAALGDPRQALGALFVMWLWSAVGVGTVLFWAALRGIGDEFYSLALAEGAGPGWRLRHVTLPAIRRTASVVALVNVALAGAVFDLAYITTGGGPGDATMLLPLDMYSRAFGGKTAMGATVAVTQVLLVLVVGAVVLLPLRGHEPFTSGESRFRPAAGRSALAAVLPALLMLLPLLWLGRAIVLPGRALTLGNAGPSLDALGANLRSAWEAGMAGALATSLLLALAVVVLTVVLALPAAYAIALMVRAGPVRITVLVLLVVALMVPPVALIIPQFSLLRDLGLLDSPPGIVLPEVARALPLAVLALWSALTGLARDPLEAAQVDGASSFATLRHIAIPLARPALAVAVVWSFAVSWNEYLLPVIVSQDGSLATVPTVLGGFAGAYDTQFGALAAGALLALLPPLLLFAGLRSIAGSGMARVREWMV